MGEEGFQDLIVFFLSSALILPILSRTFFFFFLFLLAFHALHFFLLAFFVFFLVKIQKSKNIEKSQEYKYIYIYIYICSLKVCYMDITISLLNWNMLNNVEKLGCTIFFSTLAHARLLLFVKLSCRLILWNKYSLRI